MHIRQVTADDTEAVVRLWTDAGLVRSSAAPAAGEAVARKLEHSPELFLLAEDLDGSPVGTVMGGFDAHRGYIDRLAVDPSRRRRGVGRALVEDIERRLRDCGARRIRVLVVADHAGAVAFWEAMGYPGIPTVLYCAKTLEGAGGDVC